MSRAISDVFSDDIHDGSYEGTHLALSSSSSLQSSAHRCRRLSRRFTDESDEATEGSRDTTKGVYVETLTAHSALLSVLTVDGVG